MTPEEMELAILAIFYRTEKYEVDRAANATLATTDPVTGVPISANNLAARNMWLRGTELAMTVYLSPRRLAPGMIWRVNDHGEEQPLSGIPPHEWTREESDQVAHLDHLIRHTSIRMKHRGLIDDRAPIGADGESYNRDDGSAYEFRITYKGLQEARQRVKGTRYDRRGPSVWDTLTASQKAKAMAQWAKNPD